MTRKPEGHDEMAELLGKLVKVPKQENIVARINDLAIRVNTKLSKQISALEAENAELRAEVERLRGACEAAKTRFEVIKQMQDEFSARVLINCGCDENDEVLEQLTTALKGT